MLPQLEIVRVLVAVSVPFEDNGATIDVTLTGVFSVLRCHQYFYILWLLFFCYFRYKILKILWWRCLVNYRYHILYSMLSIGHYVML